MRASKGKPRQADRRHESSRGARWWPIALILAAGIATYANSLSNPFIFDDFGSVVRNPQIRDLTNLHVVFSPPADTAVANRPLVNLSFAVNYAIGGLDVTGYRVVNLALHLACALLILALVRRTLEGAGVAVRTARAMAIASALIWTVHPMNSEVVDYVSERSDGMMALCYLFTLYASVRAHGSPHPTRWQIAAVVACAAGMLCKESMVTAPVMVALYDTLFLSGSLAQAVRTRWRFWTGLALTWLLLVPSLAARGAISTGGFSSAHATPWTYLLNQTEIVTRYLRLVFWPSALVNYYGWTRPLTLGDVWPYALFLIVLLIGTAWLFVRRPRVGFAAVWVLVILVPTSSLMPIAAEVGAERRMYLPLAGLIVLGVIGARALWSRPAKSRVLTIACILIATVFAGMTRARNREYASALTMAETVLARWPTPAAHHLVGLELAFAGHHENAIAELRIASADYAPSRFYLGSELVGAGQADEAIETLESFIRDEPNAPVVPNARTLLARAHYARQRWSEAIAQSELALAAKPDDVVARGILADSLMNLGRADEAIPQYRAITATAPSNAGAWSALGVALAYTRKTSEAIDAFARAVDASPRDARLHQNLARALVDAGRAGEAEPHARQAIALAPMDPGGHDVLARVFVAQGKIEDARKAFASALQLDPSYAPAQDGLRALRGR